jgi:hypothetical protein
MKMVGMLSFVVQLVKFEARHAWHPDVREQAGGGFCWPDFRNSSADAKARAATRRQQVFAGAAHQIVVIDNRYQSVVPEMAIPTMCVLPYGAIIPWERALLSLAATDQVRQRGGPHFPHHLTR